MSTRQGISLFLLGAIHLIFLLVLIVDDETNVGVQSVIFSSLIFLIIGYVRTPKSKALHSKAETILLPLVISAAGVLTFYLSIELKLGPVIASAGIGFLASYLPNLSKVFKLKSSFVNALPAPIYCGTFVGMCSSFLSDDLFFISYAGLIAGLIFVLTRDALNGIGGKLGTIAFGGVVIVSFIFSMI